MDVDEVLVEIGSFGWSQRSMLAVYSLFNACGALTMLLNIFVGQKAEIIGCLTDKGIKKDFCDSECAKFQYEGGEGFSIATEWDLVCDREPMIASVQTMFMLGVTLGSVLTGPAADTYGRFRVMSWSVIAAAVLAVATSLSTSFVVHSVCRFLSGLTFNGIMGVGFILVTEMMGPGERALVGALPALVFALGECALAGMAYALPGWRWLSWAVAVLCILQIPLNYWFLLESPRWHLKKGQSQEGLRILQNIARKNGTHLATVDLKVETDKSAQRQSSLDLLKSPVLRKLSLVQGLSWFTNSLVFYGLTFSAGEVGSNIYANVTLLALVEVPANLFSLVVMKKFGRKSSIVVFMIISGVALLATYPFPHLLKPLVIFSKSSITVSFAVIYVLCGEVYPTGVRNAGLSFVTLFSRAGGVLAPITAIMIFHGMNVNLLLYGAVAVLSGLVNFWYLPETLNKPLPDTEEDVIQLYEDK